MSIHVPEFASKLSSKKGPISPIDVVMGDHWGEIDLGNSMRLSLLRAVLKKQEQGSSAGSGRGGAARLRLPLSIVSRSPQAMVKVVKKGGASNARGMRDQMSYLSKDGDAKLERSERYFGIELDEEARERLIGSWGLSGEISTKSDKTTHFVVSFTADTDHDAAYRAGRAWAEEMFASGTYGDVYDYYTSFHTDRAHPHIHVVVNRRGMENGDWLKVSLRSQFNYDEFRAVQVEVAAREGIHLEATPRLARGLTNRPVPDAEIRRAEREGRGPVAPSHTPVTALRAVATLALHCQQMSADAKLLHERYPDLSETIGRLADVLKSGRQILPSRNSEPKPLSHEEAKHRSEFIMSRRSEILDGLKEIDAEIATLPNGAERTGFEREASRMKADTAQLLPDVADLIIHTRDNPDGLYKGIDAKDVIERSIKEWADRKVSEFAKDAGIDPAKIISRYDRSSPASIGLADAWRKDELGDIQKSLTCEQTASRDQYKQLAQAAYDELHRNVLHTYRKAERHLEAHVERKKELRRIAKHIQEGRRLEPDVEDGFNKKVKEVLHSSDLRQLEAGKLQGFKFITDDIDQQRALSRRYLEAEQREADDARKLQLTTALAKIDHDDDLARQQAASLARKDRDRGLDY